MIYAKTTVNGIQMDTPLSKLKQVYDLLDPYYTGEENG